MNTTIDDDIEYWQDVPEQFKSILLKRGSYDFSWYELELTTGLFYLRENLIKKYSWAIPNAKAIRTIENYAKNGLIEIGAGTGYWCYLLSKVGVDCVAFDSKPYENQCKGNDRKWFEVKVGSVEQLLLPENQHRTLFLCWVPYESDLGTDCLKLFQGEYFAVVGEGKCGCCATDEFFEYLDDRFEWLENVRIPQYFGVHDSLDIYKKV